MHAVSAPSTASLASTMVTVGVLAGVLVALGIALAIVGVRLVRATRTDHAALGPLEAMSERRWMRGDPERRAEVLAAARGPSAGVDEVPSADAVAVAIGTAVWSAPDADAVAADLAPPAGGDQTVEVSGEPVDEETAEAEPADDGEVSVDEGQVTEERSEEAVEEPSPLQAAQPEPVPPPEPPLPPEPPAPPQPPPPVPVPEPPPEPVPPIPQPPPEPVPQPNPPIPDPVPEPVPPQPPPPQPIPQVDRS